MPGLHVIPTFLIQRGMRWCDGKRTVKIPYKIDQFNIGKFSQDIVKIPISNQQKKPSVYTAILGKTSALVLLES